MLIQMHRRGLCTVIQNLCVYPVDYHENGGKLGEVAFYAFLEVDLKP